jgi:hypothetical protein
MPNFPISVFHRHARTSSSTVPRCGSSRCDAVLYGIRIWTDAAERSETVCCTLFTETTPVAGAPLALPDAITN